MNNITEPEFIESIYNKIEHYPKNWRNGQKIFNAVDEMYNVARDVQFKDGVDCFYDDTQIGPFLTKAWERVRQ